MTSQPKGKEAGGAAARKNSPLARAFIGIAGIIGAGKTTLATALGEHLGLDVHYEPVADNEYLADFYREQAKATQLRRQ